MKLNKLAGAAMFLFLVVSCNSKKTSESDGSDSINEYTYIADTVAGIAVSHECAIVYTKLEELEWKWEDIKSPSMLARNRAKWKGDINEINDGIKELDNKEKHLLDSICTNVNNLEKRQIKGYSIPAEGVIANLKDCIKRLDKATTIGMFESFRAPRIGMLRNVETIHYCVEPSSRKIGEVKQLAEIVKQKYEEKCDKFGVKR